MVCVTLSCTLRILLVSMIRPLSNALQDEHYPHFTEQEAEAQSGDLQEVKWLLNGLRRSSELRGLTHLSLCLSSQQPVIELVFARQGATFSDCIGFVCNVFPLVYI